MLPMRSMVLSKSKPVEQAIVEVLAQLRVMQQLRVARAKVFARTH